jgi:hypothetical protein
MVVEVADQGTAFCSVPTEEGMIGSDARVQDQQCRAFLSRRVHLQSDLIAGFQIGQRRGEQVPGRLNQRRVRLLGEVDGDARPGGPGRVDTLGQGCGQEAGREQFIPQGGIGQPGHRLQVRVRPRAAYDRTEHGSSHAPGVVQGGPVNVADGLGSCLQAQPLAIAG